MQIVLDKDTMTGHWVASVDGGEFTQLLSKFDVVAGDLVRQMQKANPGAWVGVKSHVFGPRTIASFGDIVWLNKKLKPRSL